MDSSRSTSVWLDQLLSTISRNSRLININRQDIPYNNIIWYDNVCFVYRKLFFYPTHPLNSPNQMSAAGYSDYIIYTVLSFLAGIYLCVYIYYNHVHALPPASDPARICKSTGTHVRISTAAARCSYVCNGDNHRYTLRYFMWETCRTGGRWPIETMHIRIRTTFGY